MIEIVKSKIVQFRETVSSADFVKKNLVEIQISYDHKMYIFMIRNEINGFITSVFSMPVELFNIDISNYSYNKTEQQTNHIIEVLEKYYQSHHE